MIKAIIFDFGSVLYKTKWEDLSDDFMKKYGFSTKLRDVPEQKDLVEIYRDAEIGKNSMRNFFLKLKPDINADEVIKFYKKSYAKHKHVNLELVELIKRLKKNYALFGFTDANKEHFEANLEEGFYRDFERIFASFEFGMRKADEKAFEHLLKHMKFKPNECLFVDDHLPNIENARKNGFHVIHYDTFPDIARLKKELKDKGIKF